MSREIDKPMYEYDEEFYRSIAGGANRSAQAVIPVLRALIPFSIDTVLDVGCGAGAWLSAWKQTGARVLGLDGDYVQAQSLLIGGDEFSPADLREPFELKQQFDLAQCLEVAEHLPETSGRNLVASLCRHSELVMFSAAVPGQGGENHINEQPYAYWRKLFADQGYLMYDPVRPAVVANAEVKPWYRYNVFVYVKSTAQPRTHEALAHCRVAEHRPPSDLSPPWYKLRKRLVSLLPMSAMTRIAVMKKTLVNSIGRLGSRA